jgi:DNA polymerase-1
MGDASDNVPGVRGVGAKSALALVQQYGAVEAVLAHAGEVCVCVWWW